MKIRRKMAKLASIGLLSAALFYSAKVIALNVASNVGLNEMDIKRRLLNPLTWIVRGEYDGFICEKNDNTDLNAIYLGLQRNTLAVSEYKPANLTNQEEKQFFSLAKYIYAPELLVGTNLDIPREGLVKIINMKEGESLNFYDIVNPTNTIKIAAKEFTTADLHFYTLSFGRDKKGIYTSIYDRWDFESGEGYLQVAKADRLITIGAKILSFLGKPINFYDRFYWKDYGMDESNLLNGAEK
jgi:hypothetical protein